MSDVLGNYTDWLTVYYKTLEGATIESFRMEQDNFDQHIFWPTFDVTLADGTKTTIFIQADAEANGEGFISGIPTR